MKALLVAAVLVVVVSRLAADRYIRFPGFAMLPEIRLRLQDLVTMLLFGFGAASFAYDDLHRGRPVNWFVVVSILVLGLLGIVASHAGKKWRVLYGLLFLGMFAVAWSAFLFEG